MTTFKIFLKYISILWIVFSYTAFADEITFTNGDRLHGKVLTMTDTKLKMKTDMVGTVEIKWSSIAAINTNEKMPVELDDGSIVIGMLQSRQDADNKTITVDAVGDKVDVTTTLNNIHAINRPEDCWSGNVAAGFTSLKGNSDKTTATVQLAAKRPFSDGRWINKHILSFNGQLRYDNENDDTSVRKGFINSKFASYFTKRWSWFITARAGYDYMQDLKLRTEESVGMGYDVWNKDPIDFDVYLAFARVDSNYISKEDTGYFSLNPGWTFQWKIWQDICFNHSINWLPSLKAFDDYILNVNNALSVPLPFDFFLKLQYDIEYTSKPPDGKKKNDRTGQINIGYKF